SFTLQVSPIAAASTALGSVALPVTVTAVPATMLVVGALVMVGFGGRSRTVTVFVSVPTPPSLSVTRSVTAYAPLSSGVKVRPVPAPVAYRLPFFVTDQE